MATVDHVDEIVVEKALRVLLKRFRRSEVTTVTGETFKRKRRGSGVKCGFMFACGESMAICEKV